MSKPDGGALTKETIVAFLADIIERRGAEAYLGEEVTISEHMLQAAKLADDQDAGDELVAAALLHDIGHFTNEFPEGAEDQGIDTVHEEAGALVVERFFPEMVVDCIRQHVAAKRYLCATDPSYFDRLSAASVHSLKLQGGPMSDDEVIGFQAHPHLDAIIKVRLWDDAAKEQDLRAPGFAHYLPLLQRVVDRHG